MIVSRAPIAAFVVVVLATVLGSACGPIRSTAGLIQAEQALRAALDAEVGAQAAYPLVLSQELLSKAQEEQLAGNYKAATDLAEEARDVARSVREGFAGTAKEAPLPEGVVAARFARRMKAKSSSAGAEAAGEGHPEGAAEPGEAPASTEVGAGDDDDSSAGDDDSAAGDDDDDSAAGDDDDSAAGGDSAHGDGSSPVEVGP